MQQNVTDLTALLARTPAALDALLRGLPETWTHTNEGPNTWTVYDILGHLVHCERHDWLPRAQIILTHGQTQPFSPLDRSARPDASKTLPNLLDDFATLRAQSLTTLESLSLTPTQLALEGQHPAFGPVTLAQLLSAWATHDLTHLHQIARVMAHQQSESVGPWAQYLGVLKCSPST